MVKSPVLSEPLPQQLPPVAALAIPQSSQTSPSSPPPTTSRITWLRLELLHHLEALHVGPTFTVSSQRRRGVDVWISPGLRLPDRITGYRDLWTKRGTLDTVVSAQRRVSSRDVIATSFDVAERGTAATGGMTWTRTLAPPVDGFVSWQSRDPSNRTPYRALQLGSDVWPLRRLPVRVEVGVRTLPAQARLYFSLGYAPRRYPAKPAPLPPPPNTSATP